MYNIDPEARESDSEDSSKKSESDSENPSDSDENESPECSEDQVESQTCVPLLARAPSIVVTKCEPVAAAPDNNANGLPKTLSALERGLSSGSRNSSENSDDEPRSMQDLIPIPRSSSAPVSLLSTQSSEKLSLPMTPRSNTLQIPKKLSSRLSSRLSSLRSKSSFRSNRSSRSESKRSCSATASVFSGVQVVLGCIVVVLFIALGAFEVEQRYGFMSGQS